MLEDRVGLLEAQLSSPIQPSDREELHSRTQRAEARRIPTSRQDQSIRTSPSNRLTLGLGVLSSVAAAEPHYFGSSSGLSLAHFVEAAIECGTSTGSEVSLPLLADRPFPNHAPLIQNARGSDSSAESGQQIHQGLFGECTSTVPFPRPSRTLGNASPS